MQNDKGLSKLAVRRLTKLADYMAKLPKSANKHFRMTNWFVHKGRDDHPISEYISRKDLKFCGTSACAFGWAATIPVFKRAGLAVTRGGGIRVPGHTPSWLSSYLSGPAIFFDITEHQARHLFGAFTGVKTPKDWAKRCRKFLKVAAKQ